MRNKLVLALLAVLTFVSPAAAQTINAASCSAANVQTAFNSVVATTTTVNIPAGTCAWATQVTLTIPSSSTTLSILGAGSLTTVGGGDATIVQDTYTTGNPILQITTNATATSKVRIAGISFEGGTLATGNDKYNGIVQILGSSANIRVDHDHFDTATYSNTEASTSIAFNSCTFGVVDHNIFDNPDPSVNNSIHADNAGGCYSDSLGVGDQEWAHATGFGTSNFLYIENNTINYGITDDCTFGGRFVARFNTMNMDQPPPITQTHPTGGAGRIRGCRAEEIYMNTMNAKAGSVLNAGIWLSSGSALIWGNTVPSSASGGGTGVKQFIELLSMRVNNSTYTQTATPNGWGYCGTGQTGTGSNWDGNTPSASTGYPCLDQPGRGQGDLLTGGFSSDGSGSNNVTNNATGAVSTSASAWPRQALDPIYEWSDAYSIVPDNTSYFLAVDEGTFTANQDYYLWCNASSTSGCTSFNGAVGTGSGTLASRPSTCTTGVGYWATDQGNWNTSGSGGQGIFYTCTSTNTWTQYYEPYTYPHPLISQINAATCNPADVQTAVNTATEGQTVNIPAGTCTWALGVVVTGKGISIQGAGSGRIVAYDNGTETPTIGTGTKTFVLAGFSPGFSASSFTVGETLNIFENNNQTNYMQGTVTSYNSGTSTLTMNITSTGGSGSTHRWLVSTIPSTILIDNASNYMFSLTEDTSFHTSLSGIQIQAGSSTVSAIPFQYRSGGVPMLVHDNWFELSSNYEMLDSTTNRGVVWNNSFSGSTGNSGQLTTTAALRIKGAPASSWTTASTWGAADTTGTGALYFETNDVHVLQSASDNDDNGRLVWRYNLMDHSSFGTHGADTSSTGERYFEYYQNTGVWYGYSDGTTFNLANGWVGLIRGGTFVMWGNTLPQITSQDYGTKADALMIAMNLQRQAGPNPCWGAGFTTAGQYYHIPRQVGFGYVTGTGTAAYLPDSVNGSTDSITYVGDSEPAYIWGNSRVPLTNVIIEDYGITSGNGCPASPTPDSSANYIQINRDYYNGTTVKPGYSAYTYPHPLTTNSGQASAPTFSLVSGTYSGSQSTTLSTSAGSTICYSTTGSPATNGASGCTTGTLYTGSITIPSSETIYAISGGTGYSDSTVNSSTYVITSGASTPTFSPAGGSYYGTRTVTLSTTSTGAVICYNTSGSPATNGSTGCTTGTKYISPITVSASETIYAVSGGTGYTDSSVGSAAFTIITSLNPTTGFGAYVVHGNYQIN